MTRDTGLRGTSRRDFIRGVFAASAALGLGPTRAFDILDKMGGSALADVGTPAFMVNIVLGTGALSRATVIFPVPRIVEQNQGDYAIDGPQRFRRIMLANGRKLYSRVVDGKPVFEKRPFTVMVAGSAQAHSTFPGFNGNTVQITQDGGGNIFSAASVIQRSLNALIPAIGIQRNGQSPNFAPVAAGAPAPSLVPDGQAMVDLFSSAASRLMTRLAPSSNQELFRQYHTAFMGLTQWAERPTYERARGDSRTALGLVVKNLATELAVKSGQVADWGGQVAQTDARLKALTEALIVTANAFRLGLCAQVTLPAFNDDPHGAFAGNPTDLFDGLARVLQRFQSELDNTPDPTNPGKKIGDRVVLTMSGDTPKNPYQRNGWPDGTPGGMNLLFVQGAGLLQPGWIGDVQPNARVNWDPVTGQDNMNTPTAVCTSAACGAVLYAVSGGKKDSVRPYYSGPMDGAIIQSLTGA